MSANTPPSLPKDTLSIDRILEIIEDTLKKKNVSSRPDKYPLRAKDKPSILILTTLSFGKGHLSAANALTQAFEKYHPDTCDITVLDPFGACNGFIDQTLKACYDNSVKYAPLVWRWFFYGTSTKEQTRLLNILSYPFIVDKFTKILADIHPDLIISTYSPLWNLALKKALNELQLHPKTINVITDSIVVHRGWVTDTTDFYMVANEETKQACIDLNVDSHRIHTFGFPVGLAFENLPEKEIHDGPLRVLSLIGTGATHKDLQLILDLKEHFGDRIHLTVITSKNKDILQKLQKAALPEPVTLVGWTDQMAQYMHNTDLILTKAGGATVMECIATKTPLIVTKVIPGQEEGNAKTITQYDIGDIATSTADIISLLEGYIQQPDRLHAKRTNFERIHKKDAAKHITDFAISYLHRP